MTRPQFQLLSQETVQQIILEGMELLMNPGVQIHNHNVLTLLAEAGCDVDFGASLAKIPESIVRSCLETAPDEFYLYDLEGLPAVHYFKDKIHFDPGSTALTVLDHKTGKQRAPLTGDFIRFVKLVETLPQIDAQSTAFICSDVILEIGDLYRLYLALNFMRKPIITGAFRQDTFWDMHAMLSAVSGGDTALATKPIAVFDICPSPPLRWSDITSQNLIDCACTGVPAELVSMPLAGAAAPVTLAGAVVQHTAESLSGVVIHQLARPRSPIIWGGSPAIFDMREATTPVGAVDTWMIDAAYLQVGKVLQLPTHTYLGMSDAKVIDAQCGLESMGSTLVAALAGANMISGAGMLDFESCISEEKLVIDAEIIGMARRLVAGMEIREQPIATSLIQEMGHNSEYLVSPHTIQWFRKEHYLPSNVIDRATLEGWQERGSKSIEERAGERIVRLLKNYQPNPLPENLRNELRKIATHAAQRFGMHKLPEMSEE